MDAVSMMVVIEPLPSVRSSLFSFSPWSILPLLTLGSAGPWGAPHGFIERSYIFGLMWESSQTCWESGFCILMPLNSLMQSLGALKGLGSLGLIHWIDMYHGLNCLFSKLPKAIAN